MEKKLKMKSDLKNEVTEAVLGFLNDASKWHDLYGMMDGAPYLPPPNPRVPIDRSKEADVKFDVPVKPFVKDPSNPNSFRVNKEKEN